MGRGVAGGRPNSGWRRRAQQRRQAGRGQDRARGLHPGSSNPAPAAGSATNHWAHGVLGTPCAHFLFFYFFPTAPAPSTHLVVGHQHLAAAVSHGGALHACAGRAGRLANRGRSRSRDKRHQRFPTAVPPLLMKAAPPLARIASPLALCCVRLEEPADPGLYATQLTPTEWPGPTPAHPPRCGRWSHQSRAA